MDYTKEWISKVRGKMGKAQFGQLLYQFKKDGSELCTVHRNTIRNWESGKTPVPKDKETFISLALLEYDQQVGRLPDSLEERNARYSFVNERMKEMLHLDLYSRNLHDALLIQICRNIISFEELLPIEREIEAELKSIPLTKQERDDYAIERNTIRIAEDFLKIKTKEEMIKTISRDYRLTFASANRIIGARITKIYNDRLWKENHIPLGNAIANYAPNYRDSYARMYTSSFISRNWLLDLCVHLRFTRSEIEEALECAHMVRLSDDKNTLEGNYLENQFPIGSMPWYIKLEKDTDGRFGQYKAYKDMEIQEKLMILLLIGVCLRDMGCDNLFCPMEYFLEAFTTYEHGKKGIKQLEKLIGAISYEDSTYEEIEETLNKIKEETLGKYIGSVICENRYDESIADSFREESRFYYYQRYLDMVGEYQDDIGFYMLYYLAIMSYSIFTGKHFTGELKEADIQDLVEMFSHTEHETGQSILRFITQFMGTFLSDLKTKEKIESGRSYFYVEASDRKIKTRKLNIHTFLEDLWESIMLLESAQSGVFVEEF